MGHRYWTIIGAPIIQEFIFRFLPFQFLYLQFGKFWEVGIISNIIFAAIHWYFGKWFTIGAFFMGMLYWFLMVRFGLVAAILGHSIVNIVLVKYKILK